MEHYQMLTHSVLPIKARVIPVVEGRETAARRVSHGATRFASDPRMRQPQDGAIDTASRIASITSKQQPAIPSEPEDARLTGLTRSLYRRLMGLNVMNVNVDTPVPTTAAAAVPPRKPLRVLPEIVTQQQVA